MQNQILLCTDCKLQFNPHDKHIKPFLFCPYCGTKLKALKQTIISKEVARKVLEQMKVPPELRNHILQEMEEKNSSDAQFLKSIGIKPQGDTP